MARAYYPVGSDFKPWTPDLVGALGADFSGMSYKSYDSAKDWDTYTESGVYYVAQSDAFSEDLNQPKGAYTYGILITFSNGANVTQLYIANQINNMWYRQRWGADNAYCGWNNMITNNNISSQSVNYANSTNYANSCGTANYVVWSNASGIPENN